MFRFAFFGTDSIAIHVLDELEKAGFMPSILICGEDKPKGRGMKTTSPTAKLWAEKRKIPVLQPKKLDEGFLTQIKKIPTELGVVASYGKIIPEAVLSLFPMGVLNVHPSILPKLRGPSPIESTILLGERPGITIIKLDKEMDHGPIVAQEVISFSKENIGYTEAEKELGIEGGRILAKILPEYVVGNIKEIPQDHAQATFTKKIKKEDALINLSANAFENLKRIKAFQEWPGAYFFYDSNKGKIRVKINDAHIENNELVLDKITPEGKKEMLWADFKKGN